jgi:hypothetical protein
MLGWASQLQGGAMDVPADQSAPAVVQRIPPGPARRARRIAVARRGLAIGDVVELEHPVLLRLVVGVRRGLPRLDHLKPDALLAEKVPKASWLMSSTTPSATKNSASFDRLHVENGRS